MSYFYKILPNMKSARRLISSLQKQGIKADDISLVVRSGVNNPPIDTSPEALLNTKYSLSHSPDGTISVYGTASVVLAALTSGVMLMVTGPVTAALSGATIAGSAITTMLSGIGVPKNKHKDVERKLEEGGVLVQVDVNKHPHIKESLAFSAS